MPGAVVLSHDCPDSQLPLAPHEAFAVQCRRPQVRVSWWQVESLGQLVVTSAVFCSMEQKLPAAR